MAKISGKNAVIFLKEYKISGDANRVNVSQAIKTSDVSCFEDLADNYVEGLSGWTMGINGYWNSVAGKIDFIVQTLVGFGTHVVGIYPQGTAPSNYGYDGKGILSSYAPEAIIGGAVVFSADLTGSGALSRAAILTSGAKSANGTSTAYNIGTAGLNQGITGVLRCIDSPHGTCNASIQASTTEAGVYGNIFSFAQITGIAVEHKNIATAAVGPWFRTVYTMTASDLFDLTITCAARE